MRVIWLAKILEIVKMFAEGHKSPARVCGASAQNQATKLFRFFREDDGYNETFAAAKW